MEPARFLVAFLIFCSGSAAISAERISASPASLDACLPYAAPTKDEILSSSRKVFAHYLDRFPLSIDNKPSTDDYYTTQFLSPEGERDKWIQQGGCLRSRPLPVPMSSDPTSYLVENLKREIRLAISRGIGGFTFDILSLKDIEPGGNLSNMIRAAKAVDSRFTIVLMPDMSALGPNIENVVKIVNALYDDPGLYRLPNGRLVVSPFLSESVSPADWVRMKKELSSEGKEIAFVPTFLSLKPEYAEKYKDVSDGMGTFGTPLPNRNTPLGADSKTSHAAHKPYMAGVSPQGYRPKNFLYWEAEGSLAYRNGWKDAIDGRADWIQLTTWNDFSESTQTEPYTDLEGSSGSGYFDLTGYYARWFLSGQEPKITRDALYYFYRKEPVDAAAPRALKPTLPAPGTEPGKDIIELVGFLTAPGTLSITIGGQTYSAQVAAGVQPFRVPLHEGVPLFSLVRGKQKVIQFEGNTPIVGKAGLPSGYADLTYWSGNSCHL